MAKASMNATFSVRDFPEVKAMAADLVKALHLLDTYSWAAPEGLVSAETAADAQALLTSYRVRYGDRQAPPDSSLLAWGLHDVDPDHRWEA